MIARREYRAPFDQPAQIATLLVLMVALGSAMALNALLPEGRMDVPGKIYFALMILAVVIGWGLAVRSYEIGSKWLFIRSFLGYKKIGLKDIRAARYVPTLVHSEIEKSHGLSGMFGYFGSHRADGIDGLFRMRCNRIAPAILIETQRANYLISPDDTREFLNELNERLAERDIASTD